MNFHHVSKYFKYLISSSHRKGHGIHSPLIFDIVSRVFRNKTRSEVVLRIEKIRKSLLHDERVINMNDLGSGSNFKGSKKRKVAEIAKNSSVPPKYGSLLFNLSAEFGNSSIIELGTSFGISTMYMAASAPQATVYTIDGCNECLSVAKENFEEAGLNNIVLMNGPFDSILTELEIQKICPGLVFIDGDHRKEPLLKYFTRLSSLADEKTVIVIDDINYSGEMSEAWNEIRQSDSVKVSIDIFRMGMVFFKRNITPGHFMVRY